MISACTDHVQQDPLIERYMQLPNQVWDDIINQASKNVDVLKDHVSCHSVLLFRGLLEPVELKPEPNHWICLSSEA